MINLTSVQISTRVKTFLELAQPLPVKYGYPRGIKEQDNFISYQDMGTTMRVGIGNNIISERKTYAITVQTRLAEDNILYSELIKRAMEGTIIMYVSDQMRKDVLVKSGWINTILVTVYNGLDLTPKMYTPEQVRNILQDIADRYLFITSIYAQDRAQTFIDNLRVPEFEQQEYTYEEVLALKQEYLDRLLLTTTEY